MNIWIDSGVTPRSIIEKLYHLTLPRHLPVKIICQSVFPVPPIDNVQRIIVGNILKYILENAEYGDLVICQDLPFIEDLVNKGAVVITPRGDMFSPENIEVQMGLMLENGYLNPTLNNSFTLRDQEMFLVTFHQWLKLADL